MPAKKNRGEGASPAAAVGVEIERCADEDTDLHTNTQRLAARWIARRRNVAAAIAGTLADLSGLGGRAA